MRESGTTPGQYVLTGQQGGQPKHLLLVDPEGVVSVWEEGITGGEMSGQRSFIFFTEVASLPFPCCLGPYQRPSV